MTGSEAFPTYAVLGNPIGHSVSPVIHNAAFRAAGRLARYEARRVSASECGPVLRDIALGGGGGNVTVPHKTRVLPFLDHQTLAVQATGACNTFWARGGAVWGDNTDVEGFRATWDGVAIAEILRWDVLVLGAGGAACAVVLALLDTPGVRRIWIWNRTAARVERLARHFSDPRIRPIADWRGVSASVLVNATSVGMDGIECPVRLCELRPGLVRIIDLVYSKAGTPLTREAAELGIPAQDGKEMLIRQAEASYACWFGAPPPRDAMRGALDEWCRGR